MTQFARDFVSSVEGTSLVISTKELSGGARVYYIFHEVFGNALDGLEPTANLTPHEIRTAIRNSTGPRPSLFIPEVAFDLLVKPQIKLLEAPSLRCVELVYEELVKICHNCTSHVCALPMTLKNEYLNRRLQELERFPRLHSQIIEVVSDLLRERLSPTSEYAKSLIEIQAAYINTNHPAFVSGSSQAVREAQDRQQRKVCSSHSIHPLDHSEYSPQPAAIEAPNGSSALDDDVDDEVPLVPGGTHRTASSSLPRSRTPVGGSSTASIPTQPHRHHRPRRSSQSSTGPQPAQGRETFLNYFFGGQGPASAPGSVRSTPPPLPPRGARSTAASVVGDLAGLALDQDAGRSAAMDMKSLGKHIDAVRAPPCFTGD